MDMLNNIANNRYWNKHGISLVWGLGVACLLLALIRVGWISYSQAKIKASNYAPQTIAPLARPVQKGYRVQDIVNANLFGDPSPPPVVKKAPKTTLNLTLQGILSATNPQFARAIIANGKKKSELYSVGETIQGAGASIKEIRATEVLLNRNGATESLPLVKSNANNGKPLISYVNAAQTASTSYEVASATRSTNANRPKVQRQFSAANRVSAQRSRAPNGKPRKVRKPNFSGLDRALKKMGEL